MAGERIGIRYCGGCNPRFDRVAFKRQIEARFPDDSFEPAGTDAAQRAALVICGCPACCVNVADLAQMPLVMAGYQDTPDSVACRLRAALEKDAP